MHRVGILDQVMWNKLIAGNISALTLAFCTDEADVL